MGLLNRKDKLQTLPPISINDDGEVTRYEEAVNYNSVVDWLCGLSDEDYARTCEVAAIYRKANADAAKALGVEVEVSSFITEPEQPDTRTEEEREDDFLNDELETAFLEDEPKKINVKETK